MEQTSNVISKIEKVLLTEPQMKKIRLRPTKKKSNPLPVLHSIFSQEKIQYLSEMTESTESGNWAPEKKLAIFQKIRIAQEIPTYDFPRD